MGLIGHNGGPTLQGGTRWRSHCWQVAREQLLPTLPIEVVRARVTRARELGLPYKTYAGFRAQTGHDVVAFLFSSNALRVTQLSPRLPALQADRLAALVNVGRLGLAVAPLAVTALATNPELDEAHAAPYALARFPDIAGQLRAILGKTPADRVMLVGETPLERDWCAAGRLGGWLTGEHYFSA